MMDAGARARAVIPDLAVFTARDRSAYRTAGRHRQARVSRTCPRDNSHSRRPSRPRTTSV